MKRIRAAVCITVLSMTLSVPMPVSAQEIIPEEKEFGPIDDGMIAHPPAQPQWVSENRASCSLSVSGTNLTGSVWVIPKTTREYSSGTLFIERKDGNRWVQVASTNVSGTGRVSASKSYTGTSGKIYRARYSGKTGSDPVSSTSNEVTVR